MYLLQIYEIPSPKGKYFVGYKDILIKHVGNVAVFYPSDQVGKDISWLTNYDYLNTLLDAAFHHDFSLFMRKIFLFGLSFVKSIKLGVHSNSRLAEDVKVLKIMIFSHGLGGNRHGYSAFVKEFASNGICVFCLDHPEKIIILPKSQWKDVNQMAPMIKEVRGEQLERRNESVTVLLDYVCNELNVSELFKRTVSIDLEKIMLGGHSFGGVTAIYTALKDKRVRGGIVCMDPYIFPMKDEFLEKKLNLPILVINTESFDNTIRYAENKERIQKLLKINDNNEKSLNVICKGSDHLHQCDLVFFFPIFMKFIKFINSKSNVLAIVEYNKFLLQLFIDKVILNGENVESVVQKVKDHQFYNIHGKDIIIPV